MKYNILGSFVDGSGEYKIPLNRIRKMFSKNEIKKMCNIHGEEIVKGTMKFWAEEAMDYRSSTGISDDK